MKYAGDDSILDIWIKLGYALLIPGIAYQLEFYNYLNLTPKESPIGWLSFFMYSGGIYVSSVQASVTLNHRVDSKLLRWLGFTP
jgi:hypothetical protein